jgi:hypothetical protein
MEGQKNRYQFVAVNSEGKKFSGTIWAVSESEAKLKIANRGLALFSLEEFSADAAAVTEGFQQFEFEGKESNGKDVHGTIEAVEAYEAYRKLVRDYDFEVKNVMALNATPEEKEEYRKKGIPPEWIERLKLEKRKKEDDKKKKKAEKKEDDGPLLSEQDRAELEFYQEEIGRLTKEVLELLEANEEFLDASARRAILDRIGLLSRLRRSNAIDHLRELTKKLLKQLADDKLFIESEKLSEEKQIELMARKSQFGDFSKQLEKKVTAGLASVSVGLAAIDPERVKEQIIESDPIRQVLQVFYVVVVSLLGLMLLYWGFNAIRLLANFAQNEILFSFSSPILWLLTGIAFIFSFGLFVPVFSWKNLKIKSKIIFVVSSTLAVGVFLWVFPMLFWWTR